MYDPYLFDKNGRPIGKAHINQQNKTITWPSGARTRFAYMLYDKDADSWYGAEVTRWYIDEAQNHNDYQFQIMRSRNRSKADVTKGIYCTLNPDPSAWMFPYIEPFIDEEGFPKRELSGKTCYFVIIGGILFTSWDKEELRDKYGKNPQTYTYIPSTLEDNEILLEMDSEYRDILDSLPERKRRQLLEGCWLAGDESGMYFQKEWLHRETHVPLGGTTVRGWDLADGEDDPENNISPDYTASVLMTRTREGKYYIHGGSFFKKRAGSRDNEIIRTGKVDDDEDTTHVIPQDPGAAGKQVFNQSLQKFTAEGLKTAKDPIPTTQRKIKKFEPFSIAAETGLVHIVESSFDKDTLEEFYKQLLMFKDERSTRTRKDDFADATATAFNYLSNRRTPKLTVSRNQLPNDTLAAGVLNKR